MASIGQKALRWLRRLVFTEHDIFDPPLRPENFGSMVDRKDGKDGVIIENCEPTSDAFSRLIHYADINHTKKVSAVFFNNTHPLTTTTIEISEYDDIATVRARYEKQAAQDWQKYNDSGECQADLEEIAAEERAIAEKYETARVKLEELKKESSFDFPPRMPLLGASGGFFDMVGTAANRSKVIEDIIVVVAQWVTDNPYPKYYQPQEPQTEEEQTEMQNRHFEVAEAYNAEFYRFRDSIAPEELNDLSKRTIDKARYSMHEYGVFDGLNNWANQVRIAERERLQRLQQRREESNGLS